MELLTEIFGRGKDLTALQMCARAVVVFLITLFFIRISGKRSFGMRMPVDNVMTILLGALLSRVVVGASPVLGTFGACFVIVVLYRLFAGLSVWSRFFGKIVKGDSVLIFKNGTMLKDNMRNCMVTEEDLIEEVRITSNLKSLDEVESAHVERSGQISIVKKQKS